MRLGSFIAGGIIGAALTIYMNKNNKSMVQSLSSMGQFFNQMMDSEAMEQGTEIFYEADDSESSYQMQ